MSALLQRLAELPAEKRAQLARRFPLSFAQRRLWFLAQLDAADPAFNVPAALRLHGTLDGKALHEALTAVVERHGVLRTVFPSFDGEPLQLVLPPAPVPLPRVDLQGLPPARRHREMERWVRAEAVRPFDLARGPLLRATLLALGPGEHVYLLDLHHAVCDGWSRGLLLREITALYAGGVSGRPVRLPELPVQYVDFARWQLQWLESPASEQQVEYWRQRLEGSPPRLDLPVDRPRGTSSRRGGGWVERVVPATVSTRAEEVARRVGASSFMVGLAAFALLLARDTGRTDLPVGSPVVRRTRTETEGMVGPFLNLVVLRLRVDLQATFPRHLERVRDVVLEAFEHQDLPFERLVDELDPERDLDSHPLFQVMFTHVAAEPQAIRLGDLELAPVEVGRRSAKQDLGVFLTHGGNGTWKLGAEYASDLFDRTTVVRLLRRYETLLERALAAPERPLGSLEALTGQERWQVVGEVNDRRQDLGLEPLHRLVARQVVARPEAVALRHGDQAWSYGRMAAAVERLAGHLRCQGAAPGGPPVGLLVDRSPDMVIALLAVLEAGAAYLPLDPAFPEDRLRFMADDAGVRVLVTGVPAGEVPGALGKGRRRVHLEDALAAPADAGGHRWAAGLDDLAYVLYTSGSTGRPKGVEVSHRSAANFLLSMAQRPGLEATDRLLAVTTLSFDISVLELLLPLVVGAEVVIAGSDAVSDGEALARLLERSGATVMQATPATWRMLLETGWRPNPGLRLLCGGEALPPDLAAALTATGAPLWNLYGPTETTVWSSVSAIHPPVGKVDVGRPVANTRLLVLDRGLRAVGLGLGGELWIGGEGVARGYRGRPALTADRFRPDPFAERPGRRLYRTGDVARRWPDGRLEHLGRADAQVKVRGFRIEPGEVETVLRSHPGVDQAVVLVPGGDGGERLVAYWVGPPGTETTVEALREAAALQLPPYMVPSLFVRLAELPLTANGKVDRRALAARPLEPSEGRRSAAVAPRDAVEEALAAIWRELLEVDRVGVHDGFFALGGHSLLATRVMARVHRLFGVQVPIRRLFEAPTLAQLADVVRTALGGDAASADGGANRPVLARVTAGAGGADLPLSSAQRRMWILEQMLPGSPTYHVHESLRLEGRLHLPALAAAVATVLARHEALRTTFHADGGRPVQRVGEPPLLPLRRVDLAALPAARTDPEARRLAAAEVRRPFDLEAGPLLRLLLVRTAPDRHRLTLTLHHVVCDGWSMGVLVRDLVESYRAATLGESPSLPELPVQYADFALWQQRTLDEGRMDALLAHWTQVLEEAPALLDLPTDRPRGSVAAGRGGQVPLSFPPPLVADLRSLGRERGATLFMVLLAGLGALLARHARQSDVVVGTPVAGRPRLELEGLVGTFVNALPLRLDLRRAASFGELVEVARAASLAAYEHQDLPFERLVEALHPEPGAAATPVFQVVLALQNAAREPLELPGLRVAREELDSGTAKFDLTLIVGEDAAGGLSGKLVHDLGLFDATTARRLAGHLRTFLAVASRRPEADWREVPLLDAAERHQLRVEWPAYEPERASRPGPKHEPERARSLHGEIARRAAEAPHRIAVSAAGRWLSYAELLRGSRRVADELGRRGAGPGSRIALFLERDADLVVAVLGVLLAGAAYVPVDPDAPAERVGFLVEDSGALLLLTRRDLEDRLPAAAATPVLRLEDLPPAAPGPARTAPEGVPVAPDDLAYVIYTSGSTGRPKGVPVSHRNVLRLFDVTRGWLAPGPEDVWTLFHSYAFDFSVWEIFGALLHGGRLEVVPFWLSRSPAEFWDRLAAEGVTVLNQTPSAFYPLARRAVEEDAPEAPALRTVIFGGEALDPAGLRPWWRRFGDRRPVLVNMFGITETTVHVTYGRLDAGFSAGARSYVGRALPDLSVALLDPAGSPVPIGVAGEIHVGGPGLARGYLDRPALTAERFVPSGLGRRPGERLYRSGDLGRYRGDGELEYLGRLDEQVKIRGFRIELGEVTAALKSHRAVRDAAVVLRQDGPGGARLVAYVVADGDGDPGRWSQGRSAELAAHLRRRLPPYMVPEALVVLDALPLTGNGKLDRRRLPAPEAPVAAAAAPLRSPAQELVASVFGEILGLDPCTLAPDSHFFALGGHSLLAAQAAHRLSAVWERRVELRLLFERPTVAELAAALETADAGIAAPPPLEPRRSDGRPVLSFAQERLWFLDRSEGAGAYNIPLPMVWRGALRVETLRAALRLLEGRHEVLRTALDAEDGQPVGRLLPVRVPPLPRVDLTSLPGDRRDGEAHRLARGEAAAPFDLAAGRPLRVTLVHLGSEHHLVLATLHHAAGDGGSAAVLVRDLSALYSALRDGHPPDLPELAVQYSDFAAWQRRWLAGEVLEEHLSFWRRSLGKRVPRLELPADREPPQTGRRRGGRVPVLVPEGLLRGLRAVAAERGATLFMVLVAAFDAFLHHLTGQPDVAVGTNVAGRDHPATRELVGCFVNQLVLRSDLSGDPSFAALVERVRATTLAAYAHQALPFHEWVAALRPEEAGGRGRLYQAKVELLDRASVAGPTAIASTVTLEPYPLDQPVVRYDLHLVLAEQEGGLRGSLQYDAGRFAPATAQRMADELVALTTAAAESPERTLRELHELLGSAERERAARLRRQRRGGRADALRQLRRPATEPVAVED